MSSQNDPLITQAMVCRGKGEPLVLQDITLPAMKATFVELEIDYCGLCHTDIHMKNNDWGISNYPLTLGHEGVGRVTHIGSSVKNIKVGDKVGITWARDSCSACDYCRQGRENICEKGYQGLYLSSNAGPWGKESYNEHGGCFSKIMRIEERFAIKLPETLPPQVACPLICGGGTVFEAIVDYVTPGTKVAVASIGGLGTAAIRFAKLYGGHVTALSRGESKREKCLGIGAEDFIGCLGDADAMAAVGGRFDLIIDTSPVNSDVAPFMGMLKFNGTYCRVGIPEATDMSFKYDYIPLIFTQKKIAGSIVTGTRRMNTMLEMAEKELDIFAKDSEDWQTEIVNFSDVNEVMAKLSSGTNNTTYRYLLKW